MPCFAPQRRRGNATLHCIDRIGDEWRVAFRDLDSSDNTETRVDGSLIMTLDGDRLAVSRTVEPPDGGLARDYQLVIVDLPSRSEQVFDDFPSHGRAALRADHVALMNDSIRDVEALAFEAGARVEVINLTTGERDTVAPGIRVVWGRPEIFTNSNGFLWQEYKSGDFYSKVRSYDPERDHMATIIEGLDRGASEAWLEDVDEDRMLITRTYRESLLAVTSLDLLTADGETTTVLQYVNPPIASPYFLPQYTISGDYVVWSDPRNGDLVIHDIDSETKRRVAPSALLETRQPDQPATALP